MNHKLYKLYFGLFLLFTFSGIQAQNISQSPYSRFGIGELIQQSFALQNGMGGVSQGLRNSTVINVLNPASYSALMLTNYEAGLMLNAAKQQNSALTQKLNNASLGYLSLAFPLSVKHKTGMALGLMPFTDGSYLLDYSSNKLNNNILVRDYVTGKSNLNRVFCGVGKNFFNRISIGTNINYIWGSANNSTISFYPQDSGYFSPAIINSYSVGSFTWDGGIQYHQPFVNKVIKQKDTVKQNYLLVVGASGNMNWKLNGTQNYLFGNTTYTGDPSNVRIWDTIVYKGNQKGYILLPTQYRAGISFSRLDKWNIYLDYEKSLYSTLETFGKKELMADREKMAAGFSWMPNRNANLKTNYLKRVEYRFGVRSEKLYYIVNNTNITEMGVSAGFSLPVIIPKGAAMPYESARIHISADYSKRGNTTNNLVQENILRIYFGITFTDKWFIQRKIY